VLARLELERAGQGRAVDLLGHDPAVDGDADALVGQSLHHEHRRGRVGTGGRRAGGEHGHRNEGEQGAAQAPHAASRAALPFG